MPSVRTLALAPALAGVVTAGRQLRSALVVDSGVPDTVQFASGAPCAPPADEVSELLGGFPQTYDSPQLKFYLYDTGAFNLTDTLDCFFTKSGGKPGLDDFDLHVMPQTSQHMTDYWLIEQMKTHPSRTMDPEEAKLFVIGAPLMTSWFAAHMHGACGHLEDHFRRADAVAAELNASTYWHRNGGRDFLYINTSPTGHFKLAVHDQLLPMVTRGLYATADRKYGGCGREWIGYCLKATVMPYKAHYLLDQPYHPTGEVEARREVSIMFHGDMGRGTGDRAILPILAGDVQDNSVRDARFTHGRDLGTFQEISVDTANTYLKSTFCFVPAGDTPTSRRLFDSLAAGCIPVVLADFKSIADNLPFKHTIDWGKVAIFAGDMKCMSDNAEGTKAWVAELMAKRDSTEVAEMRERGRKAFRSLSYHSDAMVTALLREVKEPLRASLEQSPVSPHF